LVSSETRTDSNIGIALTALIRNEMSQVFDVPAFVEFLRECIEPMWCRVETLRVNGRLDDTHGLRFQTLLGCIRGNLPPVPAALALEIAHAADALRSMTAPVDLERWSDDVGLHFAMSSSFGHKGRLLSSIVRFCRLNLCLELGTACGMSARFILGTRIQGETLHLTTVEGYQPTYALTSRQLSDRYGTAVDCRFGWTKNLLPDVVKTIGSID